MCNGLRTRPRYGEPYRGGSAVAEMLNGGARRGLVAEGMAHIGGPLLVEVDGATACATTQPPPDSTNGSGNRPWRISHLPLFLASDESRTITGQSIPVDAGGYMQR